MEAAVGALGRAFAGEHADRVFAGAAVGVDAAGVGVAAGQVFLAEEGEQLAPGLVGGGGDLGDLLVAEGFAVVVDLDLLAADFVGGGVVGDGFEAGWPVAEELEVLRGEGLDGVVVALAEGEEGAVRSEEHTSELQSLMRISYAVFCLKKKTNKDRVTTL